MPYLFRHAYKQACREHRQSLGFWRWIVSESTDRWYNVRIDWRNRDPSLIALVVSLAALLVSVAALATSVHAR